MEAHGIGCPRCGQKEQLWWHRGDAAIPLRVHLQQSVADGQARVIAEEAWGQKASIEHDRGLYNCDACGNCFRLASLNAVAV